MKILLCGATGSIGQQLLNVIDEKDEIVGIYFNKNLNIAEKIIKKYKVKNILCESNKAYSTIKNLDELIKKSKPDMIVNAVVGIAGLNVTLCSIKHKIDIALANKESLVIAGKFVTKFARKNKVKIYPIDSEHSSLYQIIKNIDKKHINELIITCSGGSTYFKSSKELENIEFDEVIKHPNWSMGYKISIDSATLINKCFEIVEAYWLFKLKNIKAVLHPQSIVHSMVRFNDGSYFLNASIPNMELSIKLAINKFKNINFNHEKINFSNLLLQFDEIDQKKHIPIQWAYQIIEDKNNSLGLIINASNEIAIELFKDKRIKFIEIIPFINHYICEYKNNKIKNFDDIFYLLDKILSSDYEQVIQNIRCNKNNK